MYHIFLLRLFVCPPTVAETSRHAYHMNINHSIRMDIQAYTPRMTPIANRFENKHDEPHLTKHESDEGGNRLTDNQSTTNKNDLTRVPQVRYPQLSVNNLVWTLFYWWLRRCIYMAEEGGAAACRLACCQDAGHLLDRHDKTTNCHKNRLTTPCVPRPISMTGKLPARRAPKEVCRHNTFHS